MDKLIEEAREFVSREIFTDGFDNTARRLVFEYESEPQPLNAKTGWSIPPIADRVAAFADRHAKQCVSRRESEIAERLRAIVAMQDGDWMMGNRLALLATELEESGK